jgi:hypothetical protein
MSGWGAPGLVWALGAGIVTALALLLPRFRRVAARMSGRWRDSAPEVRLTP